MLAAQAAKDGTLEDEPLRVGFCGIAGGVVVLIALGAGLLLETNGGSALAARYVVPSEADPILATLCVLGLAMLIFDQLLPVRRTRSQTER